MSLLTVSEEEWQIAEQLMQDSLTKFPNKSFKIRRKDNEKLIHSFFCLITPSGPVLFAAARDKYQDEGYLGEGSRGKVKVLEARNGQVAAIKIEPELEAEETRETEIAILTRKGHIFGTFTRQLDERVEWLEGELTGEKIYSILLLHPGIDMHEGYMEGKEFSQRKLSEKQKLIAAIKIALEIKDLHDHNEIHRDLKEANIVMDQDPSNPDLISLKLVDYETAAVLPEGQDTIEKDPIGSLNYTAPEALEGIFSKASDMYAFGVICQNLKLSTSTMLDDDPKKRPNIDETLALLKATLLPLCASENEMNNLLQNGPKKPNYLVKKPPKQKIVEEPVEKENIKPTWGATKPTSAQNPEQRRGLFVSGVKREVREEGAVRRGGFLRSPEPHAAPSSNDGKKPKG
ncbi:MAG: protein kinase [Candidatus Berkiella sp.]